MNKNLNDEIKTLIAKREITPILGLLCLANLNEKIEYSNRSYSHLIPQREIIAKTLIENGVEKKMINEKINTIHKNCYPTLNGQIKAIYEMIVDGDFVFTAEQITDGYIQYKDKDEYESDIKRIPRNAKMDTEEKVLLEIVAYIERTFLSGVKIDKKKIDKIKALRNDCKAEYSYELILDTVKAFTNEIEGAIWRNDVRMNGRYEYILGIVKNKLVERADNLQRSNVEAEKRTLEDLDLGELENIQIDFKDEIPYEELRKKYNLRYSVALDRKLLRITQDLKDNIFLDTFEWNREDVEELLAYYNSYRYGLVFWNEERDLESVEDLIDFLDYNDACFKDELKRIRKCTME